MSVCRMGWPYHRSIRFVHKATRAPHDFTGQTFTAKVFDGWAGEALATWTTTAGQIQPAAGGRIVIDVPAVGMVAPLRPGTFPLEVRRTDNGSNAVVFACLITIGAAVTS